MKVHKSLLSVRRGNFWKLVKLCEGFVCGFTKVCQRQRKYLLQTGNCKSFSLVELLGFVTHTNFTRINSCGQKILADDKSLPGTFWKLRKFGCWKSLNRRSFCGSKSFYERKFCGCRRNKYSFPSFNFSHSESFRRRRRKDERYTIFFTRSIVAGFSRDKVQITKVKVHKVYWKHKPKSSQKVCKNKSVPPETFASTTKIICCSRETFRKVCDELFVLRNNFTMNNSSQLLKSKFALVPNFTKVWTSQENIWRKRNFFLAGESFKRQIQTFLRPHKFLDEDYFSRTKVCSWEIFCRRKFVAEKYFADESFRLEKVCAGKSFRSDNLFRKTTFPIFRVRELPNFQLHKVQSSREEKVCKRTNYFQLWKVWIWWSFASEKSLTEK